MRNKTIMIKLLYLQDWIYFGKQYKNMNTWVHIITNVICLPNITHIVALTLP